MATILTQCPQDLDPWPSISLLYLWMYFPLMNLNRLLTYIKTLMKWSELAFSNNFNILTLQSIQILFGLKMQWVDSRVSANLTSSNKDHIQIPGHIKDSIWFPDIFILNSRKVEVPTHTWEPKYTHVFQNGKILTSILTRAEIGCPMNFLDYPVSECILT